MDSRGMSPQHQQHPNEGHPAEGASLAARLLGTVAQYMSAADVATVEGGCRMAADAHRNRDERLDGTPYIDHALRVALILADWRAPATVVAAGVLHDVLKPKYSRHPQPEPVESRFGPEVAALVTATSLLSRPGRKALQTPRDGAEIDNEFVARRLPWVLGILRKSPLAVVVKLADRLDNFESLSVIDRVRRKGFAAATLRVFVPCADWLGMWAVRRRLEDCAFAELQPQAFGQVADRYRTGRHEVALGGFGAALAEELRRRGVASDVAYVRRSLHSLHRDEVRQRVRRLPSQSAHPLLVLVEDRQECYRAQSTAHAMWRATAHGQVDYISAPKPNGYRSLHTVVETASGPLPICIRSRAMHLVAEWGITAMWRGAPVDWMPQLPEAETAPAGMIAVYSTRGELQILGQGATPVDFALARGEEYGIRCVQAMVNEWPVDLDHRLADGDVVRLFTSKADVGAPERLMRYVNLPESRDKLRQASSRAEEQEVATRGWQTVARRLGRMGVAVAPSTVDALLRRVTTRLEYSSATELLVAVDQGEIDAGRVVGLMRESVGDRHRGHRPRAKVAALGYMERELIYAGCCNPGPPDEIVAYASRPQGLVIHRAQCGNVRRPDRVLPAKWEDVPWQKMVAIEVVATDRLGLVHDVSAVMAEEGICMSSFHADQRDDGSAAIHIGLGDLPTYQLRPLLARLRTIPCVRRASSCGPSVPSLMAADGALAKYLANPYTLLPVTGNSFHGRDAEMGQLLDNLRRLRPSESVLVWGPRRIGKTSLLLEFIRAVLSAEGYAAIYIDMQRLSEDTVADFLTLTIEEVVESLQNPNVIAPTAAQMEADPLREFKRVMHSADDFDSRRIVLIFDEFERVADLKETRVRIDGAMSYMRSLMLGGAKVSFVFCGGGALQPLLDRTAASSLLNVTHHQRIGCLDEQAARRLVAEPVTRVRFGEGAVARLLDLTARHPFYLQMLCSQLLEAADRDERGDIQGHHVDALLQNWLPGQPAHYFDHLWGKQTAMTAADAHVNRRVLASVVEHAGADGWTSLADIGLSGAAGSGDDRLQQSVRDLRDLDAVARRGDKVRLTIPLFQAWMEANLAGRRHRAAHEAGPGPDAEGNE